ncbi:anti-silence-domain-containing protein [Rhodotorula sp. JG-1b]|nr:anti-silence-domain-containing protein [Rhodotorula sp. JG-1b]
MSIVNISDVTVLNNSTSFTEPYRFKITFECMAPLQDDLEWKLTYVGSAESESYDQELDTCMAAAPLPHRIPSSDLIGVTVILLTCSYNDQEFVRIGYYVNTEYGDPDLKLQHEASLAEDADEKGIKAPDPTQHIDKLVRNVLADKPRVTKFNIQWDTPAVSAVPTMSSATTGAIGSEAMAGAPAAAAPPPPFNPYQAAA